MTLQVSIPPFPQGHSTVVAEDFDVAHCTQIPNTRALSASKRPRKQGPTKSSAEGVDTTPKPATRSRTKTTTTTFGKQTCCSFTKGWADFCTANGFKLGDVVKFTYVGLLEFEVRKLWTVASD